MPGRRACSDRATFAPQPANVVGHSAVADLCRTMCIEHVRASPRIHAHLQHQRLVAICPHTRAAIERIHGVLSQAV